MSKPCYTIPREPEVDARSEQFVVHREERVPRNVAIDRLSICRTCSHYRARNGQCEGGEHPVAAVQQVEPMWAECPRGYWRAMAARRRKFVATLMRWLEAKCRPARTAPLAVFDQRMQICTGCQYYHPDNRTCFIARSQPRLFAKRPDIECPERKWSAMRVPWRWRAFVALKRTVLRWQAKKEQPVAETVDIDIRLSTSRIARNAATAGVTFATRPVMANRVEQAERAQVCQTCEFRRGWMCGACGCALQLKRRSKGERCPFGKWPTDRYSVPDRVQRWCVGMTTAPRQESTVRSSLDSMREAGWRDVHVFDDAGKRLGSANNFRRAMANLIARDPHADAYMIVQDDVQMAAHAREYLEQSLWPEPAGNVGVVSPYCYGGNAVTGDPWALIPADATKWGALALIFTPVSARRFIADTAQWEARQPVIDRKVGRWCKNAGMDYYRHVPSLVQHTGMTSTISGLGITSNRRARDFCHDARDLCQSHQRKSSEP